MEISFSYEIKSSRSKTPSRCTVVTALSRRRSQQGWCSFFQCFVMLEGDFTKNKEGALCSRHTCMCNAHAPEIAAKLVSQLSRMKPDCRLVHMPFFAEIEPMLARHLRIAGYTIVTGEGIVVSCPSEEPDLSVLGRPHPAFRS